MAVGTKRGFWEPSKRFIPNSRNCSDETSDYEPIRGRKSVAVPNKSCAFGSSFSQPNKKSLKSKSKSTLTGLSRCSKVQPTPVKPKSAKATPNRSRVATPCRSRVETPANNRSQVATPIQSRSRVATPSKFQHTMPGSRVATPSKFQHTISHACSCPISREPSHVSLSASNSRLFDSNQLKTYPGAFTIISSPVASAPPTPMAMRHHRYLTHEDLLDDFDDFEDEWIKPPIDKLLEAGQVLDDQMITHPTSPILTDKIMIGADNR